MRLVPNWREVLRYAWSIRLLILAGALSGAEVALPLLQEILPIHRGVFAGLSALTVCGAFVSRIVAQKSVSGEQE
ncbi:hypothetical protein [Chelatococcus sp.]|uniref:DUF7940 domain-containing protein n=1 Tax=Chelatococcus sp. TaxID=1953771 RepID=UPI001EB62B84|nr:hypothetical protein [Chelatococcus sp.]MBX3547468.1 hypothetical protein [Chelatococcus sp.]